MSKKEVKVESEQLKLEDGSNLIIRQLEDVMHSSMMPYAEYVILDRALPRVEDGLKPVQRRILFTMYELGMFSDKPYRKSARIVGDCLGKYHPHGDRSVYDAMVRMAQGFSMRHTLIDGQGNFGSIDGDSAAAMRYTEARLRPIAMELIRDIDKETVNFTRNFDDTLMEPEMLPGRFPNLLVNGASGIAVGLATNIPPHNLAEVIDGAIYCIDHKVVKLADLMKIIKGPDFPTGAYVIATELEKAYETGRGRILMRAKVTIEPQVNDRKNIVITELPYQVNKSDLLVKILQLREDKKEEFSGIAEIVDESDKDGIRAVIRVKKDFDANRILELLYKNTDMQCTFGINMVAIAGGKPRQLGLIEILQIYTNYQREVIVNRTRYLLDEARARAHIVEGLVIAVTNIDEVIAIIKSANGVTDARAKLRTRFKLSEVQAQAILDLRLARLTKLEVVKLTDELAELKAKIEYFVSVLASKIKQNEILKDELSQIKKLYKEPRLTTVVSDEKQLSKVEKAVMNKKPEKSLLVVSSTGVLRHILEDSYSVTARNMTAKNNNDCIALSINEVVQGEMLVGFTNKGNCIKIDAYSLPITRIGDKGVAVNQLVSGIAEDERIIFVLPNSRFLKKGELLFMTAKGMIKRSSFSEYDVTKMMFQAIKLRDDDEVVNIEVLAKGTDILCVSSSGMAINFAMNEVPNQGRISAGVKSMNIEESDSVAWAGQVSDEGEIIIATDNGTVKRVLSSEIEQSARYRKGVKIVNWTKSNGKCVKFASYVTTPYDLVITYDRKTQIISSEDIEILSRVAAGKNAQEEDGVTLISMQRVVSLK